MRLKERIGAVAGAALAPLAAVGSLVRRARLLHPDGVVYRGVVTPAAEGRDLESLADTLAGPALVRLSSAWWKGDKEWPDVLGLALRLRSGEPPTSQPDPGDQDLLFATIRSPWTTLLAPLATDPHSFLRNNYYGVSPFRIAGLGRVKLRLRAPHLPAGRQKRAEALARAAADGLAVFAIEVRRLDRADVYRDVATLRLIEPAAVDEEALRFSPFRTGRGVQPVGFVHALRRATYAASQAARPPDATTRVVLHG